MKLRPLAFAIAITLSAAGCANQVTLNEPAVMEAYPAVVELQKQLAASENANIQWLSPEKYKQAQEQLAEALQWGKSGNAKADLYARNGLVSLAAAHRNAALARDVFEDVLRARSKAVAAGASQFSAASFGKADQAFLELTTLLESGKQDKAKAGRADVIAKYSASELAALKADTTEKAREALAQARATDVDDYAPKTLRLAEEEMTLAMSVLDADRSGRDKADRHAQTALYHAQRATQIAEMIKVFKSSDFSHEDIVLWYQNELGDAVKPVAAVLPFNQPNKVVVRGINQQLTKLTADLAFLEREKNETIASLIMEKDAIMSSVRAESEREQAIAAKYAAIQTLFDSSEAEVYRQKDNVLISAHGFRFASGKSTLESENFTIINKIVKAINEFPNAAVMVSGHTDSQGDDLSNKILSQDRADRVADFLVDVSGISPDKVTAIGYGESRPVANNEKSEGRASNRRVEILLDNTAGI